MNKHLSKIVKEKLTNDIKARDNWMIVIKYVHNIEMELQSFKKEDYYKVFFSDKLSNVQSIIRIWRLIQERLPELRGEEWEKRQGMAGITKTELRYLKNQLKLF